jgi:lysophospholipase L1-like esterase
MQTHKQQSRKKKRSRDRDTTTKKSSHDIVLIGSSIISKWKLNHIFGFNKIKNNGISGLFTKNLFKTHLDFTNPKYIIFYCGGNDLRNHISSSIIIHNTNNYIEFLISQYPNTKIILLSILLSPSAENDIIEPINKWYHDIAIKYTNHIIYINVNTKMNKHDYYKSDGIHLNQIGYDKLQNTIESHINTITSI